MRTLAFLVVMLLGLLVIWAVTLTLADVTRIPQDWRGMLASLMGVMLGMYGPAIFGLVWPKSVKGKWF